MAKYALCHDMVLIIIIIGENEEHKQKEEHQKTEIWMQDVWHSWVHHWMTEKEQRYASGILYKGQTIDISDDHIIYRVTILP